MPPTISFLRRLGAAGARDNAYRSCEEHRLLTRRVEALARRLEADRCSASGAPVERRQVQPA